MRQQNPPRPQLTGNLVEYARLLTLQANDPAAGSNVSYLSGGTAFNTAYELIGRDEPFIMWAAQGNLDATNKFSNLDQLRSVVTARPHAARNWRSLAESEAVLGNRIEALRCAEKAVEIETEGSDTTASAAGGRTTLAFVYAWIGDKERALTEYATLLRTPFSRLNVHEMKRDPRYHPLQGDPRFEALLADPKNNAPLF